MGVLNLIVPGADFSSVGYGQFTPVPNPSASLYAGYFFGTAYGGNPLKDVSGAGRTLTNTEVNFGQTSSAFSASAYLVCPFHGHDLSGGAAATMVLVAQSAYNRDDFLAGDFVTSNTVPSISLIATSQNPISAFEDDTPGVASASSAGAVDNARGSRFEMYAGIYSLGQVGVYRGWGAPGSMASQYATSPAGVTTLGSQANPITIGSGPSTPYSPASAPEIACALFYSSALTQAQLDTVRGQLRQLLGGYGLTL